MSKELLIVNKVLLPKCYEKVVQAKALINEGKVDSVSKACKSVGISRGTFYKYQEYVFEYKDENINTRKLVISFSLTHKAGSLSKVCDLLSKENVSITTISQANPIGDVAPILLTIDISKMKKDINNLKKKLESIDDISQLKIIAAE